MHNFGKPTLDKNLCFVTLNLSKEFKKSEPLAELFDKREYCDEFIKSLIFFIDKEDFQLFGFVVLTDHINLILECTPTELPLIIQKLKERSAKETLLLMGKNLNSMDDSDNRRQKSLRIIFNNFLNNDESVFWHPNDSCIKLNVNEELSNITPITSKVLISHLHEQNRNYLQLGVTAFTKIMMQTI